MGADVPDLVTNPDKVKVVQFKGDEEKEIEVIDKRSMIAPMEEGKYFYSLKLEWDSELVGQAYFAFSILVR
ncbi:hypothetical protein [Ornithinibacillus halophilus]|uniref:Uncharacterized protein n=1 Tax=Ornithinibacillus halophilus TaxID=930117 RepID=A0A1M5DWB2_9BACI|nr:hypothetical protein [Ornithinibacillus halophilus]SHF71206.1 hypothetical protein SAMN05216225_100328 [Ornithinibacillus halophilus]